MSQYTYCMHGYVCVHAWMRKICQLKCAHVVCSMKKVLDRYQRYSRSLRTDPMTQDIEVFTVFNMLICYNLSCSVISYE